MSKTNPVIDFESAKNSFERIFISTDPFAWPFHERIKDYIFFYPTEGYALTKKQYVAIMRAAEKLEDNTFYHSVVEAEDDIVNEKDILDRNIHWLCENPDYKEYFSIVTFPLECGLYSEKGNWGILISQEEHAIVGGTNSFMDELRKKYPDWKKDREELFRFWKNNPNGNWINIFEA